MLDGIFSSPVMVRILLLFLYRSSSRGGIDPSLFLGQGPSPFLPGFLVLVRQALPGIGHGRNHVLALCLGNSSCHGHLDLRIMLGHEQCVARVLALWRTGLAPTLLGLGLSTALLAGVLWLAVLIERGELVG